MTGCLAFEESSKAASTRFPKLRSLRSCGNRYWESFALQGFQTCCAGYRCSSRWSRSLHVTRFRFAVLLRANVDTYRAPLDMCRYRIDTHRYWVDKCDSALDKYRGRYDMSRCSVDPCHKRVGCYGGTIGARHHAARRVLLAQGAWGADFVMGRQRNRPTNQEKSGPSYSAPPRHGCSCAKSGGAAFSRDAVAVS
jgi:hypothetical protein